MVQIIYDYVIFLHNHRVVLNMFDQVLKNCSYATSPPEMAASFTLRFCTANSKVELVEVKKHLIGDLWSSTLKCISDFILHLIVWENWNIRFKNWWLICFLKHKIARQADKFWILSKLFDIFYIFNAPIQFYLFMGDIVFVYCVFSLSQLFSSVCSHN